MENEKYRTFLFLQAKVFPCSSHPEKVKPSRVCGEIILALLWYFSVKTLPWLNMDLFCLKEKESPASPDA